MTQWQLRPYRTGGGGQPLVMREGIGRHWLQLGGLPGGQLVWGFLMAGSEGPPVQGDVGPVVPGATRAIFNGN